MLEATTENAAILISAESTEALSIIESQLRFQLPHFEKTPGLFNGKLILGHASCNGVGMSVFYDRATVAAIAAKLDPVPLVQLKTLTLPINQEAAILREALELIADIKIQADIQRIIAKANDERKKAKPGDAEYDTNLLTNIISDPTSPLTKAQLVIDIWGTETPFENDKESAKRKVMRWMSDGTLPANKHGKYKYLVSQSALERLSKIERQKLNDNIA